MISIEEKKEVFLYESEHMAIYNRKRKKMMKKNIFPESSFTRRLFITSAFEFFFINNEAR